MSITTRTYTAEDLWAMGNVPYVLIRGELREGSPSNTFPSFVAMRFVRRIGRYLDDHPIGELSGEEGGYILARDPDSVVAPDVAFVRNERVGATPRRGFSPALPDLVIEVMSPSNTLAEIEEKIGLYLAAGIPLVWWARPETRIVSVHRPGRDPMVLSEGDELDGEDVLPGFLLPVADVFL